MIMLDAVRVARCNMHDVHSRDGISVFLPRVQFLQLIKPISIFLVSLIRLLVIASLDYPNRFS